MPALDTAGRSCRWCRLTASFSGGLLDIKWWHCEVRVDSRRLVWYLKQMALGKHPRSIWSFFEKF